MSGHSKWATIKHQKGIKDKARGQIFSKLSKAISVAVAEGGGEKDFNKNFKLRLAIEKAREFNMPKVNIDRAIVKGAGVKKGELGSIQFEGYGPEGIGIIVEAITDKRQRTVQEIKNFFEKNGGSIASPGSVIYNFNRKGEIIVAKNNSPQEQMLILMDIDGIEDVDEEGKGIRVITGHDKLYSVVEKIKENDFVVESSSLIMVSKTKIPIINKARAEKVVNFIKKLREHSDVQTVFTNFDISSGILK